MRDIDEQTYIGGLHTQLPGGYAQKGSMELWKPSGRKQQDPEPKKTESWQGTKSVSQMKPKSYTSVSTANPDFQPINKMVTAEPTNPGVDNLDSTKKKMIPDSNFGDTFGGSFGG